MILGGTFVENTSNSLILSYGLEIRVLLGGVMVIENDCGYIEVGSESTIGFGSMLVAADAQIIIGNHVVISFDVTIYTTNSHSFDLMERRHDVKQAVDLMNGSSYERDIHWNMIESEDIVIQDDVWIGFGASVLKGVTVGKGAIIGAKSVVTHDVEPFTVVAGNPARLVRRLGDFYGNI